VNLQEESGGLCSLPKFIALLLLTILPNSFLLVAQLGPAVRSDMLVSTDWLARHLHDPNLIILCVIDDERLYSSGHIPGARMIRLSEIVTTRDGIPNELPPVHALERAFENAGINNNSRIILYGERSGILAARAYYTLDYLGLGEQAALLDGGMEKWEAEKREQSTEIPAIRAGKLSVRARPEIVVSLKQMAEYSRSPKASTVLMDSRPRIEYAGERLSEDVSKAGHIPHSVGLHWHELVRDDSIPELQDAATLQELFRASGVVQGKEVVTYCRTGMQSSFSYFVAKYLGFKVSMYDGSFYEWSRSSLPVEP